jgi:hypothetical protein
MDFLEEVVKSGSFPMVAQPFIKGKTKSSSIYRLI